MSVEVYIATHKKIDYEFPDYCRKIQVNCANNLAIPNYLHDNEITDNISNKNESYCELTALYCLWKGSDADIKGLYHYRRFFTNDKALSANQGRVTKKANTIKKYCLSESDITAALENADVIVEVPYYPYPMNVEERLLKFCYQKDIDVLTEIIKTKYPLYWNSYKRVMESKNISYCNMIITGAKILNEYCTWLFSVLSDCEKKIDIQSYDVQHKRVYGYFAEVLMNVFIMQNNLREKHVVMGHVFEERTKNGKMIDWWKILMSNFFGKLGIALPTKNAERVRHYNNLTKKE